MVDSLPKNIDVCYTILKLDMHGSCQLPLYLLNTKETNQYVHSKLAYIYTVGWGVKWLIERGEEGGGISFA